MLAATAAKLENAEAGYYTGWSLGKESLKPGVPDTLKGSYYINCAFYKDPSLNGAPSCSPNGDKDYGDFTAYTAPNAWPTEDILVGFRAAAEELCTLIIDTATLVARACDQYAIKNVDNYENGYLERMVKSSMTTKARLLHYFPPPNTADNDANSTNKTDKDDWCATHIDHSCLTGLTSAMFVDEEAHNPSVTHQKSLKENATTLPSLPELDKPLDPNAGLYIHSRSGAVTKVSIPRDCLAFQTGEALERITQGRFKAVPHFVRGASGKGGRIARNTLAVFTQPNLWEMVDSSKGLDFAGFAEEVALRHR